MTYKNVSYKEDKEFANNPCFLRAYDKYYKSSVFFENVLSKLYLRNVPSISDISRSEEKLLQKGVGVDALLYLSNGTTLLVDEKTDRPIYNTSPNIIVEVMSNPQKKEEGWGYHRGRYISYSASNDGETGLNYNPYFFFIDERFINNFTRNERRYPSFEISKKTEGLYASIVRRVPKEDIVKYLNGESMIIKPKERARNLFESI